MIILLSWSLKTLSYLVGPRFSLLTPYELHKTYFWWDLGRRNVCGRSPRCTMQGQIGWLQVPHFKDCLLLSRPFPVRWIPLGCVDFFLDVGLYFSPNLCCCSVGVLEDSWVVLFPYFLEYEAWKELPASIHDAFIWNLVPPVDESIFDS